MSLEAILFIILNIVLQTTTVHQENNIKNTARNDSNLVVEENHVKKGKERKIAITLESVLQMSNDHVGGDWRHFLSVQKKIIKKGETEIFVLKRRAPLSIVAHSVEEDKDFSDTGDDKMDFIYSDLIAIDKTRFELDVMVVENSGQYAGNTAVWKFLFVIQRV